MSEAPLRVPIEVLYGHCFCGLLAYEVARRLVDSGRQVSMLVTG